ncbi:MAG: hypothetical protein CMJ86_05800, partial [Planctomycetes bacterium]|nr:hypothetical protein [Planctomycetota bacterium]
MEHTDAQAAGDFFCQMPGASELCCRAYSSPRVLLPTAQNNNPSARPTPAAIQTAFHETVGTC